MQPVFAQFLNSCFYQVEENIYQINASNFSKNKILLFLLN